MISTLKNGSQFVDQSEDLKRESGEDTYKLVQAAMRAGLTEFSTPTPADGEGRIDWKTRRWVSMKDGKVSIFTVAFKEANAHFEVVGPEVKTDEQQAPPANLQKR